MNGERARLVEPGVGRREIWLSADRSHTRHTSIDSVHELTHRGILLGEATLATLQIRLLRFAQPVCAVSLRFSVAGAPCLSMSAAVTSGAPASRTCATKRRLTVLSIQPNLTWLAKVRKSSSSRTICRISGLRQHCTSPPQRTVRVNEDLVRALRQACELGLILLLLCAVLQELRAQRVGVQRCVLERVEHAAHRSGALQRGRADR